MRTDSLAPWLKAEYWRLRRLGFRIARNWFVDSWSGRIADTQLNRFMFLRPKRTDKRIPCVMLYRGPHVLADGRITACSCRDLEGDSELALGSVLERTIDAAWKDGTMEGLRRRFVAGDPPDICVSCTHYTPVNRMEYSVHGST